MKRQKASPKAKRIRLPRPDASLEELNKFFDRHDGVELAERGIMEVNPEHEELERMRREYWREPNTRQLNVRIPATARRMIERLAKRKTMEVSTLVRMWVIEGMRRESQMP